MSLFVTTPMGGIEVFGIFSAVDLISVLRVPDRPRTKALDGSEKRSELTGAFHVEVLVITGDSATCLEAISSWLAPPVTTDERLCVASIREMN